MTRQAERRRQPSWGAVAVEIHEIGDDGVVHDADGWLFRQELVDCGKALSGRCRKCAGGPSHGPYWYRYRWSDGRMHKRYVGRRLPWEAGDHPVDTVESGKAGIHT